jgi:hypothetical protein
MANALEYKGEGQPVLSQSAGWLGPLGRFIGQEAPAYQGAGQPATGSAGFFATAVPVYQQPVTPPTAYVHAEDTTPSVILACPAECDPLAQGPIAIIVPRRG